MQARGGINIPPPDFLPLLRKLCDEHGALLILDEIYTGFGRTGKWFACEHSGVAPDLICLGKALTGGFPLSACVGRADLMDAAWPASTGEAIHTSTFLGHPVGCAMALAQIVEIRRQRLVERSARLGRLLLDQLQSLNPQPSTLNLRIRGCGLMAGIELLRPDGSPAMVAALSIIKRLLHRGFVLLPEGEHANVISFTPPLTISAAQLRASVAALADELEAVHRETPPSGRFTRQTPGPQTKRTISAVRRKRKWAKARAPQP
jgi:4-aminobutyrate aminotransferase-like enzyme